MELSCLRQAIPKFDTLNHTDRLLCLAWYLTLHGGKLVFTPKDISKCFDVLTTTPPASVADSLRPLANKKNPDLLKKKNGYVLETRAFDRLNGLYGQRYSTVLVDRLLSELPGKLNSKVEKIYLEEAIACYRHQTYRAAVVMAWNLAYDHFCQYIFCEKVNEFNAQLPISFRNDKKLSVLVVTSREDFAEIKESQLIHVAKAAGIIDKNIARVLEEKLARRNLAAHPSSVSIEQLTAEEFIRDIVENVILKIK